VAVKPVESGCGEDPDGEDGVLLARATGQIAPERALVRLGSPVAPPEAADREGVKLDPDLWLDEIRRASEGADLVLVEGAGGLLSPLTWDYDALDLARELGAGALLVGADRLGTQNHVLLCERTLAAEGVPLLGVVLSAPGEPDASTGTNGAALRRLRPGLRLCEVPRLSGPEEAVRHVAPAADWAAAP
jgi:dethiobiotin synthetase